MLKPANECNTVLQIDVHVGHIESELAPRRLAVPIPNMGAYIDQLFKIRLGTIVVINNKSRLEDFISLYAVWSNGILCLRYRSNCRA